MKASKRIIRKVTISLLAVLIGNILGCHPAVIPSVEAASVTGIECTSDIHCPSGQFCHGHGFHAQKFCSPCQECSKFNRRPNPENGCAKRRNECGPCLDGHVETHDGGVCTYIGEEKNSKDENAGPAGKFQPWWIVLSVAFATFVVIVIVGIAIWRGTKHMLYVGSDVGLERLELHRISPPSTLRKREEGYSVASAPLAPIEYHQQPPFHTPTAPFSTAGNSPLAYRFESEVRNPRMRMETYNRADPFQAGYGAGDWATQEPGEANNQNLDEIEDFVDGNPPGVAELNPSGDIMDPSEPLLENLEDSALLPACFANELNELDQENIEDIVNDEVHPQIPDADSVMRSPPHSNDANENSGFLLGFEMNYSLGLIRRGDGSSDNTQLSRDFDPSETRVDLRTMIESGPGSPESNDSGTNMEVEDNEELESDIEDAQPSREVPTLDQASNPFSLLLEDDNSFDSFYDNDVADADDWELDDA